MRERIKAFGHSDEVHRLLRGNRHLDPLRIGKSDVLRGQDHQPARDKERVLAAVDHAREPIDRGIRIARRDGFDERANDVVVLLAALVVG